jgi:hypothetical protein
MYKKLNQILEMSQLPVEKLKSIMSIIDKVKERILNRIKHFDINDIAILL